MILAIIPARSGSKSIKKPNTDSVVGVCEAEHNPYHVMTGIKNNYLIYPLFKTKKPIHYRQATPKIYRINGCLYIFKKDVIMKKRTIFTKKTRPLIMSAEYSLDIDEPTDLLFAETLIKEKIVSFS